MVIGLLVVALALSSGVVAMAVAALAVAAAVCAGLVARRIDRPHRTRRVAPVPSVSGAGVGGLAAATLVVGAVLPVRGAGNWLMNPWFSQLGLADWMSRWLAVEPIMLGQLRFGAGMLLLVPAGYFFRHARRFSDTTAEWARRLDRRAELLYFRSFDDDTLAIPTTATSQRPFIESFSLSGREPFEVRLAWQLNQYGPVVAIAQPGAVQSSLGASRESLPVAEGRTGVPQRMDPAQAIAIVIGRSAGLSWELEQVIKRGHANKTTLVVPPVSAEEARSRWSELSMTLVGGGVHLQQAINPASALIIVLNDDGSQTGFTARRRDEAGYRAALDAAVELLGLGQPVAQNA